MRKRVIMIGVAVIIASCLLVAEALRRRHNRQLDLEVQTKQTLWRLKEYAARAICEGELHDVNVYVEITAEFVRPLYAGRVGEPFAIENGKVVDEWRHPMRLVRNELLSGWKLVSAGPNGRFDKGNGDDIVIDLVLNSPC